MKVDLHSHTRTHSDGKLSCEELVRAAIDAGLDGIVITDHYYVLTDAERELLRERFAPFRVFRGVELSIARDDVVVMGGGVTEGRVAGPIPYPRHANDTSPLAFGGHAWGKGSTAGVWLEVAAFARRTGALTILAHPFHKASHVTIDLDAAAPDAIEVASPNTPPRHRDRIERLAARYDMAMVSASDAHDASDLGRYYVELDDSVATEDDLAREVRAGRFTVSASSLV